MRNGSMWKDGPGNRSKWIVTLAMSVNCTFWSHYSSAARNQLSLCSVYLRCIRRHASTVREKSLMQVCWRFRAGIMLVCIFITTASTSDCNLEFRKFLKCALYATAVSACAVELKHKHCLDQCRNQRRWFSMQSERVLSFFSDKIISDNAGNMVICALLYRKPWSSISWTWQMNCWLILVYQINFYGCTSTGVRQCYVFCVAGMFISEPSIYCVEHALSNTMPFC